MSSCKKRIRADIDINETETSAIESRVADLDPARARYLGRTGSEFRKTSDSDS